MGCLAEANAESRITRADRRVQRTKMTRGSALRQSGCSHLRASLAAEGARIPLAENGGGFIGREVAATVISILQKE
jgi:hypothetical protein